MFLYNATVGVKIRYYNIKFIVSIWTHIHRKNITILASTFVAIGQAEITQAGDIIP